jgi:hypothetical protein
VVWSEARGHTRGGFQGGWGLAPVASCDGSEGKWGGEQGSARHAVKEEEGGGSSRREACGARGGGGPHRGIDPGTADAGGVPCRNR